MRRLALLALTMFLASCAAQPEPLPTVRWQSTADAMRILRERAHAVKTVSAQGTLTLTRSVGNRDESIRLDAAIVAQPPDRLRLRAWKLGRAVMDLTLTPDGLWLISPDSPDLKEKVKSAGVGAGRLARSWSVLSGGFFDRSDLAVEQINGSLLLSGAQDDLTIQCYVDRRTLLPRLYMLQDGERRVRFAMNLEKYRLVNGIAYPHRLRARSEAGLVVLDLREVELNGELAPAAFVPPRRAEKLPP